MWYIKNGINLFSLDKTSLDIIGDSLYQMWDSEFGSKTGRVGIYKACGDISLNLVARLANQMRGLTFNEHVLGIGLGDIYTSAERCSWPWRWSESTNSRAVKRIAPRTKSDHARGEGNPFPRFAAEPSDIEAASVAVLRPSMDCGSRLTNDDGCGGGARTGRRRRRRRRG